MRKRTGPVPNLLCERQFCAQGMARIVGLDEAGRGPWAGPVTAAAVALPVTAPRLAAALAGLRDSKTLTAAQREALVERIQAAALAWGVGSADNTEIDALGIVGGTKLAMARALAALAAAFPGFEPECLLLDGMVWPERTDIPQVCIVDGDARSLSIAAASILAKTARDADMTALDASFPGYGFAEHKGYGTPAHLDALRRLGPCGLHRRTFRPVRAALEGGT